MSVAFDCPLCGKHYAKIPPKYYGKRIRCRECDMVMEIPHPPAASDQPDRPQRRRKKRKPHAEPVETVHVEVGSSKAVKKKKRRGGWSLKTVYVAIVVLIFLFGWLEMAAGYAREFEDWKPVAPELDDDGFGTRGEQTGRLISNAIRGTAAYFWNGLTKLGSLPSVIVYNFTQNLWVPITVAVAQVLCFFGVIGMSQLERKHAEEERRQRAQYPELH